MSFETCLRATELLLALALLQSTAEHLRTTPQQRLLFGTRVVLCGAMLVDIGVSWVLLALTLQSLAYLRHFNGPYNGGSDRMVLLVLYCMTGAHWFPEPNAQYFAIGYLGLQLVLSYFISGQVKLCNPDWRNGQALVDVFRFSAYPVSSDFRALGSRPRLLLTASWSVILFELCLPFALLDMRLLVGALTVGFTFHIANAVLFGLNRFVWSWLAAYPSAIWLQGRIEQMI